MKTLHYAGFQPEAKGFGWATCNANLREALQQYFKVNDSRYAVSDVCFMPLMNHDFEPANTARGQINIAYSFFEFPLGEHAAENAAKYDTVFVGSTWCLDRCWERGITNAKVLIQGVDHSIFKPRERPLMRDGFRIFSGGKFEWRKGQDLVIAAFAEFAKTHPDAHLVAAWHNNWPQLIGDMIARTGPNFMWKRSDGTEPQPYTQEQFFIDTLLANGIPRDRFTILPQLDQPSLAAAMRNTDVGLFPNRCEGGTNLVLMEYAACGKRAVANTCTGHADVKDLIGIRIPAGEDENHWADQPLGNIRAALDVAYANRHVPDEMSALSAQRNAAQNYTWATAAAAVAEEVERIAGSK